MRDLKLHPDCMSDLAFDRVLGDSAEPSQRAQVLTHVDGCARCASRWQALAKQRTDFLERMPSWRHLQRQQQPKHASMPSRSWLWGGGAALAASLLLTFWFAPSGDEPGFRRSGFRSPQPFLLRLKPRIQKPPRPGGAFNSECRQVDF